MCIIITNALMRDHFHVASRKAIADNNWSYVNFQSHPRINKSSSCNDTLQ